MLRTRRKLMVAGVLLAAFATAPPANAAEITLSHAALERVVGEVLGTHPR